VGRHERWFDDEVYESYLTLLDICCAPIHEHGDWYPKLFLSVSLIEELDEKKFNPLPAGIKFFRGVGYISQVEHLAAKTLLLFWVLRVEVVTLNGVFKLSGFVEVLGHVCC
jgi:hypothetical protein|tara:strand:+ start:336 stop:668 length:333 start_codon:yes stop_codon:yes gene_type:complete